MSSSCDRNDLKTEVNSTFADLIDSFALQCTQINSQDLKNLFMIAGRIELTRSSGVNTVNWRGGAYSSINAKTAIGTTIGFSGTPAVIQLTYPTAFTTGKTVLPISTLVTPDIPLVNTVAQQTSYAFATQPTSLYTNIIISRQVKYSGLFKYTASAGSTNYWGIGAVSPLANSTMSAKNPSTGAGYILATNMADGTVSFKMNYDLVGAPMITPLKPDGPLVHPYFCTVELDTVDKSLFYVRFWDIVTGLQIIPDATNAPGFYADFGTTDWVIDAHTTDFANGAILYFFGLFQTQDNP